jgi:hypothetical protein
MELLAYYAHSLSQPRRCAADFAELADLGVAGIIHSTHEQDLGQWPKDIARAIEQAERAGLGVYLQFGRYGGVFTGSWLVPSTFAVRHPDACLVDLWGNAQPICCLNSEQFRDWYFGTTEALLRAFPGAGVVLDEPKAAGLPCACETCRTIAGSESPNGSASVKQLTEVRTDSVVRFCADALASIKGVRSGLGTVLLVLPRDEELFDRLCRLDHLDRFGTKPYWLLRHESLDFVAQCVARVKDLASENEVGSAVAVQNFGVSEEREPELRRALDIAVGARPDCLIFHYYGRNNDRPDRVWEITREALAKAARLPPFST